MDVKAGLGWVEQNWLGWLAGKLDGRLMALDWDWNLLSSILQGAMLRST